MSTQSGEVRVTEGFTPDVQHELQRSVAMHDRGSFKAGGTVPADGSYTLHKNEVVIPAQSDQSQQDAPNAGNGSDDESTSGAPVSLQKAYSLINERLCQLFDANGVKRSFSIPYLKNQETADHVASLGAKLPEVGGVTKTFILTFHHAGGKGWHSEDGMTVGFPIDALKKTLITKEKPEAISALSATKSFLNKISGLIGDTKTVSTAKSQLSMVSKMKGEGMDLFDFGAALIALVSTPLQEIARAHHNTKSHGPNHARLSPPRS